MIRSDTFEPIMRPPSPRRLATSSRAALVQRALAAATAACSMLLLLAATGSAQGPRRTSERDAGGAARHPLQEVMDFAAESREALKDVKDYTAVFTKSELVGNRMVKQVMEMKCREKPFSVYFKFRSGPEEGREVIYASNANNGNVWVHETGIKAIAGTVSIRPNGHEVMDENRYPLTQVGISNMLETAYRIWETEKKFSTEATVEVKYFPNAKLGDVACQAVQITHKQQRKELEFHLSRVYFDKETKLPIRAERYGWPRRPNDKPPLVEEYTYSNLKTNVGLKDIDFSPRNRNYDFP